MIEVIVKYKPDADGTAEQIRRLVCNLYATQPEAGVNPLVETKFNDMLADIAQMAFDEGRAFEKSQSR